MEGHSFSGKSERKSEHNHGCSLRICEGFYSLTGQEMGIDLHIRSRMALEDCPSRVKDPEYGDRLSRRALTSSVKSTRSVQWVVHRAVLQPQLHFNNEKQNNCPKDKILEFLTCVRRRGCKMKFQNISGASLHADSGAPHFSSWSGDLAQELQVGREHT